LRGRLEQVPKTFRAREKNLEINVQGREILGKPARKHQLNSSTVK